MTELSSRLPSIVERANWIDMHVLKCQNPKIACL